MMPYAQKTGRLVWRFALVGVIPITVSVCAAQAPPIRDSPRAERSIQAHRLGITAARFAPSGKLISTSSLDGTVCVWQVPSLARQWCGSHGAEVYSIRWSADGRTLASTGGDARVVQWQSSQGRRVHTTRLPHRALTVLWAGDSLIVAPTVQGEVVFISPVNGAARTAWTLDKEVLAAAVSPDGEWIATSVPLELHRLANGQSRRRIPAFGQGALAFHPAARSLAVAEWVAGARIVELGDSISTSGLRLPKVMEFAGLRSDTATVNMPSTDVVYVPNGSRLAVAGTDGGVWLWNLDQGGRAGATAHTWQAHRGTTTAVDISSDAQWVLSAGLDRQLRLWRMP